MSRLTAQGLMKRFYSQNFIIKKTPDVTERLTENVDVLPNHLKAIKEENITRGKRGKTEQLFFLSPIVCKLIVFEHTVIVHRQLMWYCISYITDKQKQLLHCLRSCPIRRLKSRTGLTTYGATRTKQGIHRGYVPSDA